MAIVALCVFALGGCAPQNPSEGTRKAQAGIDPRLLRARAALDSEAAEIGPEAAASIRSRIDAAPQEFLALLAALGEERRADRERFLRVDKVVTPLAGDYEPQDIVPLDGTGLSLSRPGHRLRKPALMALLEMDRAARTEGVTLLVSSAYRSYAYQREVFARNVAEMGEAEARRVSAEPGRSQHQLGTAIDFGSIDDSFAETKAGVWLLRRAGDFGFSLSYPKGLEGVTGYVWESWHYRYLGTTATRLERDYFGGVQQYLIVFLSYYQE